MNQDQPGLTDEQFSKIVRRLPTDTRGKERVDDRRVISGIARVLKIGRSLRRCPARLWAEEDASQSPRAMGGKARVGFSVPGGSRRSPEPTARLRGSSSTPARAVMEFKAPVALDAIWCLRRADLELPPVSRRAQPERQRNPGAAVENQINPDEKADHPKSGGGPLCKNHCAQNKRDDSVRRLPTPAWESNNERSDQFKQPANQEEYGHDEGHCLGADNRSRHQQQTRHPEENRA